MFQKKMIIIILKHVRSASVQLYGKSRWICLQSVCCVKVDTLSIHCSLSLFSLILLVAVIVYFYLIFILLYLLNIWFCTFNIIVFVYGLHIVWWCKLFTLRFHKVVTAHARRQDLHMQIFVWNPLIELVAFLLLFIVKLFQHK